jgi:type VI secretion system secreted protein VgrG
MNTLVLNDEFKHVQNNSKTIIDNDKEETVEANSILTVNKDYTQNIKENQINTVEKEKITTVKEDYEIFAKKDLNTIVKRDKKTYVEQNISTSIKNILLEYVQKDVSDKYLENLFIQVANEMGVDISDSFHLDTTNVLFEGVNEITLEVSSGISLRCGGNVVTVDSSGIFFNTPNYVKNSGDDGVNGNVVGTEGDVINIRINNINDEFITKKIDKDVVLKADTSLKEGTSIEATIFILDKEGNQLASETQTTSVQNSQISQEYDIDKLIEQYDISIEDIYEIDGEMQW